MAYAKDYLSKHNLKRNVHLAVGELETFMVKDARNMHQLLVNSNLTCDVYVTPDENHASIVPTILSRAFRFCELN